MIFNILLPLLAILSFPTDFSKLTDVSLKLECFFLLYKLGFYIFYVASFLEVDITFRCFQHVMGAGMREDCSTQWVVFIISA